MDADVGAARPAYDQLFIRKLNVFTALFVLVKRRFRGAKSIYCREASTPIRWLCKDRIRVIPDHTYTKVQDHYFVGMQFEMISALSAQFFLEVEQYLRRYFELRMQEDLLPGTGLLLDWKIMSASLSGRTCILIPSTPFLAALRRQYATEAVAIDSYWSGTATWRVFRPFAVWALKVARAADPVLRLRGRRVNARDNRIPSISVLSSRGAKSLRMRTDLFWLDGLREYSNVVVEVSDWRLARFSAAVVEELKRRKIRLIETHRKRRIYANSIYWKPGGRFIRDVVGSTVRLVADLVIRRGDPVGLRWWKFAHALHYWLVVCERLAYYRSFNIKAELRIGMGGVAESAHSAALNACGGIACTAQHAMGVSPVIYTSTSTFHLYFGMAYENSRLPLRARFGLANGYTFKADVLASEDVVLGLKTRLRDEGITRSVGFFEERPSEEFRARFLSPAYRFLFQRVLDDPEFGLILKPKHKHLILAEHLQREVGPTFDEAMRTGRIIILGWDYYPGVVGRAVDLVVGLLSTATLETAILGCPTLHLNIRNYVPPFFESASEHIFDSVPDLSGAVNQFFASGDRSRIGRHSEEFIRGMDHYDDSDASARIEYLVTRYVEEVGRGQAPESALNRTIQGFRERWGWHEFGSSVEQEVLVPEGVGGGV